MNAQTRRALVNKYVALMIDGHSMHSMLDALVCEWGLEMAKIAKRAHDPTASDAVFTEVCVAVAETITAANDQQKGA